MDGPSVSTEDSISNYSDVKAVKKEDKVTHYHISAFLLTFFGYSFFHVTRKTFSNVKVTMSKEWSPYNTCCSDIYDYDQWNSHTLFQTEKSASLFLGTLDTVFMVAYAAGLYVSGILGDRFDLRLVLSFGMWLSALWVFFFGTLSAWANVHNYYYYLFMWMIAGFLQSSGWPSVVAIIGNWFGKSSRGLVMGVWGACASVGNIIGSYTVSGVLSFGYEYAFLVTACMMFGGGIVIFFGLVSSPVDVGLPEPEEGDPPVPSSTCSTRLKEVQREFPDSVDSVAAPRSTQAIGFFRAFLLPGVLPYSLAYACLKLVNYSFFFWLPYYLHSAYGWAESESDSLSTWYDMGGIIGSIVGGVISDRMRLRSPIAGILLFLGIPALFIYNASPPDKTINAVLMTITGFFIGGAANLISTTVSADLGKQKEFSGNKESLATVTGIIDGTGSVGAAIGQLLIPVINDRVGWSFVFYLFMIMTFLTLACISRIIYNDLKELHARWRTSRDSRSSPADEDDDLLVGSSVTETRPLLRGDSSS